MLGELKITGYSGYLHPVAPGLLLGIGRAGDELGVLGGVKLALFNISDLSDPREVAAIELGGGGSETAIESDQ